MTVRTVHQLVASVRMHLLSLAAEIMAGSCGLSTTTRPVVSDSLASCTEETFDAVNVVHVLRWTRL